MISRSKIEWEDPVFGRQVGTDGHGTVVNYKKMKMGTHFLHVEMTFYLDDEDIDDPRPAIEAAIAVLQNKLGM